MHPILRDGRNYGLWWVLIWGRRERWLISFQGKIADYDPKCIPFKVNRRESLQ